MNNLSNSFAYVFAQSLAVISIFLPRILAAIFVCIVGLLLAKLGRKILTKVFAAINVSGIINKTPLQLAFEGQNIGSGVEKLVVGALYWLMILVVIHATAGILEIHSLTLVIEKVLNYIPQILSALVVLGFGLLLAGLIESVVKGAARNLGIHNSILMGKIASYVVISVVALSALSELGIAKEFITIIFIGLVSSASLASALALGLGSKDVVNKVLSNWYERTLSKPLDPVAPIKKKTA